jgi:hypothetical protein
VLNLSHSRRTRRAGEWTDGKAVTFIVTLAAHRSVTLAAARAGMSRKAAYALKRRDCGFAAAWKSALAVAAAAPSKLKGDTEVHNPPIGGPLGNSVALPRDRSLDARKRDFFFAGLAATRSSLSHSDGEGDHPQGGGGAPPSRLRRATSPSLRDREDHVARSAPRPLARSGRRP